MENLGNFIYIDRCENRFKKVAGIKCKIVEFPLQSQKEIHCILDGLEIYQVIEKKGTQTKTSKDKSKAHGEVFTPLPLVDKMIEKKEDAYWLDESKVNCDLCTGY